MKWAPVSHDGLLIGGLRTMLILLVAAIAFEIIAFLILLPHNLLMAIIGATIAGTVGIVVTGTVLAMRGDFRERNPGKAMQSSRSLHRRRNGIAQTELVG
jgi:hypothetical protein